MDDIAREMNFTTSDIPELKDFQHERSSFEWILIGARILSSISLALYLIAFMVIPELRKHLGKYTASLGIALITYYLSILLAPYIFTGTNASGCSYFLWFTYYFVLASQLWIAIIGFEMWKILSESLTMATFTSRKRCKRFVYCSLLAWLLPGLFVGSMLVIDLLRLQYLFPCFDPELSDYYCWLYHSCNNILIFHVPVIFLVSVGILFLILTGKTILTCEKSKAESLATLSQQIQIIPFVIFAILSYVTRVLELLFFFVNDMHFHYVIIFNTIHGIAFFFAFTCTGNARIAVIDYIYLSKGGGSTSDNKPTDLRNHNSLPQPSDEAELEMKLSTASC